MSHDRKTNNCQNKTKQKQYCNKFNKDFKNGTHKKKKKKHNEEEAVGDSQTRVKQEEC